MGSWFSSDEDLRRELEATKKINEQLRSELAEVMGVVEETLQNTPATRKNSMHITSVSRKKLLQWVDHQLEKEGSNIVWMPDAVERQLKADIFSMMLNMFDHILETTKIEIMGHKVVLDLI